MDAAGRGGRRLPPHRRGASMGPRHGYRCMTGISGRSQAAGGAGATLVPCPRPGRQLSPAGTAGGRARLAAVLALVALSLVAFGVGHVRGDAPLTTGDLVKYLRAG